MNFFDDNPQLSFQLTHPLMARIVDLREKGYQGDDSGYAPRNLEDATDNYSRVLSVLGEICGDVIAENAEKVDAEGPTVVDGHVLYHPLTAQNHETLTKSGLYGISLPRQYGGLNFPIVPYVMSAELVSRADGGFANIWGLQDCAETIHEFASQEQKDRYLPMANEGKTFAMALTEPDAGSDLQAVMLKATQDENGQWRLNGVKRFITNGDADISLVMARSEEGTKDARGISLYLYDRRNGGVTVRRIEHKMGIIGSPTCELVFRNAPAELIGDRKMGLIKYVMSLMNSARLGVGAQSVGIAEAALRTAERYAAERAQFGKTINQFIAVSELLALMRAKLDACRALLYETSRYVDLSKAYAHLANERKLEPAERTQAKEFTRLADIFTPITKLFSSEMCNQICYDALQIHGGTGFMKDFPIERHARDARILPIYEGTSQLQVVAAIRGVTTGALAARIEVFDGMVDPAVEPHTFALLRRMRPIYAAMVERNSQASPNLQELIARRLVEVGGFIATSYILLIDAARSPELFATSARLFARYAWGEIKRREADLELLCDGNAADYIHPSRINAQ